MSRRKPKGEIQFTWGPRVKPLRQRRDLLSRAPYKTEWGERTDRLIKERRPARAVPNKNLGAVVQTGQTRPNPPQPFIWIAGAWRSSIREVLGLLTSDSKLADQTHFKLEWDIRTGNVWIGRLIQDGETHQFGVRADRAGELIHPQIWTAKPEAPEVVRIARKIRARELDQPFGRTWSETAARWSGESLVRIWDVESFLTEHLSTRVR